MKLPVCAFTVYDKANEKYAIKLRNSLRKFHSEEELPLIEYGPEIMDKIEDSAKYYRATPMFAKELLNDYELVIKLDADQIILGDLDHIINIWKDYDVGCVLNINRIDPSTYGLVGFGTINPNEYYNNGLVAMRNVEFVQEWWNLCNSVHFDRIPMREQGFLNILAHYGSASGKYRIRCFDNFDRATGLATWNGLVFKGEESRAELKDNQIVLSPDGGGYPDRTTVIKAWHVAGGSTGSDKLNYRTYFSPEVCKYIDWLVSD